MSQKLPSIAASFSNLHPLKFEQHWRENIGDILHGMRRFVPKMDMDIAESEYVELLRCEHLLKELYPIKYIALKRQKPESSHALRHLTGVLFHVIQDAGDTTLAYKVPAAMNELVSLKKSKEEFEELQINSKDTTSTTNKSTNGSLVNGTSFQKELTIETLTSEPRDSDATNQKKLDIQSCPTPHMIIVPGSKSANEKTEDNDKAASSYKDTDWTMVPFEEFMKMRSTIEYQKSKITELTNRLGRAATIPITDEAETMSTIDVEYRPSRLADRFSAMFKDEWLRAFEACTRRLHWRDMDTIFQLLRIVRYAYDYCETTAKDQLDELETVLSGPILHPKGRFEVEEIFEEVTLPQKDKMNRWGKKYSKDYRRHVADLSVPEICMDFKEHIVEQVFKWRLRELPEQVTEYIDRCVEVLWYMCIQEPPMVITWANDGESVNSNYYNFYARRGNVVRQAVWPAVFLHNGGPLVCKGYVLADTFSNRS
ncbi:hypothetical protein FSP39_021027 [Pinctada imbricata]|uniref:Mitochondria-eating protein C-terminal domain-containing protein n=1 Tax=Pinctada imbricata TaxID=66713 RepID=A0AA89C974_PINIB|nr:hypothetical protein FSP39_021027 [Pinctada imbricata]